MYGQHIGTPVESLQTPALIVDLAVMRRNIGAMMAALDGQVARLRPHTKVQKSPDIALLQVAAGAIGVTVATIWEAAAMAAAGVAQHPGHQRGRRRGQDQGSRRARRPRRPGDRGRRPAQHRGPVGGDDRGRHPGRHPGGPGRRHGPVRRALAGAGAGPGPAGTRCARARAARRAGLRRALHARAGRRHQAAARDGGDGLRVLGEGPAPRRRAAGRRAVRRRDRHLQHHRAAILP